MTKEEIKKRLEDYLEGEKLKEAKVLIDKEKYTFDDTDNHLILFRFNEGLGLDEIFYNFKD